MSERVEKSSVAGCLCWRSKFQYNSSIVSSKSDHMTFVHFSTRCEIPPSPPLSKGGMKTPPFVKGAARKRGGISVRDCANLMWFDLGNALRKFMLHYQNEGE